MDDRKELLNALRTISDVCDDSDCKTCPLANNNGVCMIQMGTPALWELKRDEELEIWRAFND